MRKILIVIINDFPYRNGETFFENEIDYLSSRFDQIIIFSVCGRKNEQATRKVRDNVLVYPLSCNHDRFKYVIKGIFLRDKRFRVGKMGIKRLLASLYLRGKNSNICKKCVKNLNRSHLINQTNEYFIYSYWLTLGLASVMLRDYFSKRLKKNFRTISRCHGYDIYSEVTPIDFQPFQEIVIEELDNIYSCSSHGAAYLQKKYPKLKHKILISRISTDDRGIKQFDFENTKKIIFLTVSGFRPIKRLGLFAKAFLIAADKSPNIYWDALGDGSEFEKVKNIVANSKHSDRVNFYGSLSNNEIFNYYLNNNVFFFVNVSSSEGIPVSIMEAISFGVPVLATNVGGNDEIVGSDNGFLLKADINENMLSDAIIKCTSVNKNKYCQMRQNSRKKWESLYNSSKNLELWYKYLVNSNK